MTTMQPTWREERRRDRMAEAQIARDNAAARAQSGVVQAEAQAKLRARERQGRQADRAAARKQRALRRAQRTAWLRDHVTGLLFVPVIAVPAVLAWTAMAAFGRQVFGAAGYALPAFSEGAMWAFAGATTITRHRHPERPVWHLRAGTVLFAGVGAALNFIHGAMPAASQLRGAGVGIVMALVSVAGVAAHQLITAGPRRSRADRSRARAERAAKRREDAIRRAALRRTVAVLDADGDARLMHRAGAVELVRKHGRVRLEDRPDVHLPHAEPPVEMHSWPRPAPVLDRPAALQADPGLRHPKHAGTPAPGVPQTSIKPRPAAASNGASKPAARKPQKIASKPSERRREAERLLRENPAISIADLVARSGVSKATADRIRAELPRHLHIAEG